jgi:hypothetical protein
MRHCGLVFWLIATCHLPNGGSISERTFRIAAHVRNCLPARVLPHNRPACDIVASALSEVLKKAGNRLLTRAARKVAGERLQLWFFSSLLGVTYESIGNTY